MRLRLHERIIRVTLGNAMGGHCRASRMCQIREHGVDYFLMEGDQKLEWRTWQQAGDERRRIIDRCEDGCERMACINRVTHGAEERRVLLLDLRVLCIQRQPTDLYLHVAVGYD